jgi:hypothetical protein
MWKGAVMVSFEILSQHSPEGMRKTMNNLHEDSRCLSRDSSQAVPEYKLDALPSETTRLVLVFHNQCWHASEMRKMSYSFSNCTSVVRVYFISVTLMRNMKAIMGDMWPPLWSSGQSSWLQIQRPLRFPAQPNFLRSSGSGTGSTQPREDNWDATWKDSSGAGIENRN